jgi:hypothetical protein
MSALAAVAERGNSPRRERSSTIRCADGFTVSVIAGPGTYCTPRPALGFGDRPEPPDYLLSNVGSDYPGPYTEVECGFPSVRPEPWACPHDEGECSRTGERWECYAENPDDPTETVYGYVPVAMVQALLDSHGGEA